MTPALAMHYNLFKVGGSSWGDEIELVSQGEMRCYAEGHRMSWRRRRGIKQCFRKMNLALVPDGVGRK